MVADVVRGLLLNAVSLGLIAAVSFATNVLLLGGIAVGVNWLVYIVHALPQDSEKFFDATGSLTYITLVISSLLLSRAGLFNWDLRQLVLAGMVLIWCLRLGSYLLMRILREGKDSRFEVLRANPIRWLGVWSLQAAWTFLVALPATIIIMKDTGCAASPSLWDIAGWSLWVIGMLLEIVADKQKEAFRADKTNEGKFITTGLWAYSRHPNYFGEIVLWIGVATSGVSCFQYWDWLAWLSPATTFVLLNFVSGVPMLERKAKERWGEDPAWQWYTEKTPCMIPSIIRPQPYNPDNNSVALTQAA